MAKTIYVDCPFCEGMMEVNPSTGEVVQKWSAEDRLKSGDDKMASALKKLDDDKKKRANLFELKKSEMDEQRNKLDSVFKKEIDKAKKEGVKDKPLRPFDLD